MGEDKMKKFFITVGIFIALYAIAKSMNDITPNYPEDCDYIFWEE